MILPVPGSRQTGRPDLYLSNCSGSKLLGFPLKVGLKARARGEQAIRRDVFIKEYNLSNRQAKALGHIMEHGSLTIQDFEGLCPDVNRRSLQRDLKAMVDMGLVVSEGATNKLVYRMKEAS